MKFQDDISMPHTHTHTHTYIHTDKPKPICPPLFQSWGHKNAVVSEKASFNFNMLMSLGQGQEMTFTNTHIISCLCITPLGHRQL